MLTLTIPVIITDGALFKTRLDRMLEGLRRVAVDRSTWSAFWFLEFQGRGAPHVHIYLSERLRIGVADKMWADLWLDDFGVEVAARMLKAACNVRAIQRGGGIRYARKYASKSRQKDLPAGYESVGRWWGVRGVRSRYPAVIQEVSDEASGGVGHSVMKGINSAEEGRRLDCLFAVEDVAKRFLGADNVFIRPWKYGTGITVLYDGDPRAAGWITFMNTAADLWFGGQGERNGWGM